MITSTHYFDKPFGVEVSISMCSRHKTSGHLKTLQMWLFCTRNNPGITSLNLRKIDFSKFLSIFYKRFWAFLDKKRDFGQFLDKKSRFLYLDLSWRPRPFHSLKTFQMPFFSTWDNPTVLGGIVVFLSAFFLHFRRYLRIYVSKWLRSFFKWKPWPRGMFTNLFHGHPMRRKIFTGRWKKVLTFFFFFGQIRRFCRCQKK